MPTSSSFNPAIAYPAIFERLQTIEGIRNVKDGRELQDILRGQTTGQDKYAYLFFDSYEPTGNYVNNGKNLTYQITYTIYLISKSYAEPRQIAENGAILGRIIASLSGWNPVTGDSRRKSENLINTTAGKAAYGKGLAIYPVQFQHTLTIGNTP